MPAMIQPQGVDDELDPATVVVVVPAVVGVVEVGTAAVVAGAAVVETAVDGVVVGSEVVVVSSTVVSDVGASMVVVADATGRVATDEEHAATIRAPTTSSNANALGNGE
jgi:hypothetical protein